MEYGFTFYEIGIQLDQICCANVTANIKRNNPIKRRKAFHSFRIVGTINNTVSSRGRERCRVRGKAFRNLSPIWHRRLNTLYWSQRSRTETRSKEANDFSANRKAALHNLCPFLLMKRASQRKTTTASATEAIFQQLSALTGISISGHASSWTAFDHSGRIGGYPNCISCWIFRD